MATIYGTSGNDTLIGTNGNDNIYGYGGNDRIEGGNGNDTLRGGDGSDSLFGGAGDDALQGDLGSDRMEGGTGNDTYFVDGNDYGIIERAGEGIDNVVSLMGNYKLSANTENLRLGGVNEVVDRNGSGNTLDNIIQGNAGKNSLFGDAGNDTIYGYAGDDAINGGTGNDFLNGGDGSDLLTYKVGATGGVTVNLSLSGAQNTGSAGVDKVINFENLEGTAFGDVLTGNSGANKILGLAGNDTIRGGAGNDDITGGAGADSFLFEGPASNGVDTLRGFETGVDKLIFDDADGYSASAGFTTGSTAVGAGPQFVYNPATHALYYDADGAGGAAGILLAYTPGGVVNAGDIFVG